VRRRLSKGWPSFSYNENHLEKLNGSKRSITIEILEALSYNQELEEEKTEGSLFS
jgi:hypothetical protein